jgi:hypothetical protein
VEGWDKAVQKAYNAVLDQAGVSWGKVAHLRKAGSRGDLDEAVLGSMSNHTTSKLGKCYHTELFPSLLRVMSGFDKDDVYFCPHTGHFGPQEMPESILSSLVFPRIGEWREQCLDPVRGDNSEAAKNFIWGTLPFLALVAFQDGIYWIKDFPEHEASHLLVNIMRPWYRRYALMTRRLIADQVRDARAVQLSALNNAAQGAFYLAAAGTDNVIVHSLILVVQSLTLVARSTPLPPFSPRCSSSRQRLLLLLLLLRNPEIDRQEPSNRQRYRQRKCSPGVEYNRLAQQLAQQPEYNRLVQQQ